MATALVTGSTGNVGSAVVRELLDGGVSVRAFVRDPARAAERLGADPELAVGDLSDPASVRRAMEGVELVFLASGDGPQKVDHEVAVIDAAAEAGVRRLVKASTAMAEAGSPLLPFDWNGRIEDHLRGSGVPAVVLQSSFYMTNLLMSAEQVRNQGMLFAPAGGGKVGMIDTRDVAAVAAKVLTGDGYDGKTYALTGPEAITFEQVAEELSAALGRPVAFVDLPEDGARQGLVAAGLPDWLVDHLFQLFRLIRQGALGEVTNTVRELTGREPRSLADFVRERAALFGP